MKKLSRRQLRQLINEEAHAVVSKDAIQKAIIDTLNAEGGAAGLAPLVKAVKALANDDLELPEDLKDADDAKYEEIIVSTPNVKKHAMTDYIEMTGLSESNIRRIIRDVLNEGKDEDVPAHFGSGKDITVFGYKTKHFEICLSATNLFNELKDRLNKSKLDGVEKLIKKAAKISDQIFGLEKRVVKRGTATKAECDRSRELFAELKDCLRHVLGSDTNKKLSYMPMHIREITKRKEK
tara:strand:- start:12876 stop:13586 length:711 start_codon:yes stop_codon:yes gene_type:complete